MAPDRPENSDQDGAAPAVMSRVFGFVESFGMKDAEGDHYYVEETTTTPDDSEVVIGESGDAKPAATQQQMDDDLTSLSWLHQQNLLKGLEITQHPKTVKEENILNNNNVECEDSLDVSENTSSVSSLDDSLSHESNEKPNDVGSPDYDEVIPNEPCLPKEAAPAKTPENSAQNNNNNNQPKHNNNNNNNNNSSSNPNANINLPVQAARNKHPNHVPYDPYLHRNCKPPYSFSCLIFMAIEDSPVKALPVKEVYAWILEHFPYFRNATPGWKNSVRHNLSLNKCFRKVEKSPNLGKGSLWMVDAQYRPNLLQALSRSPYPPPKGTNLPGAEKPAEKSSSGQRKVTNTRLPDPVLFPYLSKRLASSSIDDNQEMEFDSDVDAAAAAMLAFKHGPIILNHNKERKKKPSEKMVPVITRSSIEDHTYSLITSVRLCERRHLNADNTDFDEQRKIAEGADALLNLAGVATTLMKNSSALPQDDDYENNYGHRFAQETTVDTLQEIRPIKKRRTSTASNGEGANKRRKIRPWQETWNENGGRYLKQVRG